VRSVKFVSLLVVTGFLLVLFAWPKQEHGPEPIAYGRDSCAHCRMQISQRGFGAELRSQEGKLTKYDDIGCMLLAMSRAHREFQEIWVEDHLSGDLIHLMGATLVRGSDLGTPMGHDILAFKDPKDAERFVVSHKAEIVPLEILLKDKERLARKGEHQ
jgi:copper chaperone NosL